MVPGGPWASCYHGDSQAAGGRWGSDRGPARVIRRMGLAKTHPIPRPRPPVPANTVRTSREQRDGRDSARDPLSLNTPSARPALGWLICLDHRPLAMHSHLPALSVERLHPQEPALQQGCSQPPTSAPCPAPPPQPANPATGRGLVSAPPRSPPDPGRSRHGAGSSGQTPQTRRMRDNMQWRMLSISSDRGSGGTALPPNAHPTGGRPA